MLNNICLRSNIVLSKYITSFYHPRLYSSAYNPAKNTSIFPQKPKKKTIVNDFVTIYKYPSIRTIQILSRLKIYSILSTCTSVPTFGILEHFEIVPENVTLASSYLGGSLLLSFTVVGLFLYRFVGLVYYNSKTDSIKVAYLSFLGNRKDVIIPRVHVTSFVTYKLFPLFSIFKDEKTKEHFKIVAYDGIVDAFVYNRIFKKEISEDILNGDSNTDDKTLSNINVNDLVKKIQEENKKNKK